MAENVRQGFRAGGRAPRGYRLATIETGAIREGAAVTKTKLEPNDDASSVADYLRLRAEGIRRTALTRQLKIKWPITSLIGLEWNALTYGSSVAGVRRAATVKSTREKFAATHDEDITGARAQIAKLDARSGKLLEMASELKTPAPVLRKVDELDRQRSEIEQRVVDWEKEDESAHALANVTDARCGPCSAGWPTKCGSTSAARSRTSWCRSSTASSSIRNNKRCNSVTASHSVVGIAWRPHGDQSLSPPLSPVPWPRLHSDRAHRH
jgi:hypothetical protein